MRKEEGLGTTCDLAARLYGFRLIAESVYTLFHVCVELGEE